MMVIMIVVGLSADAPPGAGAAAIYLTPEREKKENEKKRFCTSPSLIRTNKLDMNSIRIPSCTVSIWNTLAGQTLWPNANVTTPLRQDTSHDGVHNAYNSILPLRYYGGNRNGMSYSYYTATPAYYFMLSTIQLLPVHYGDYRGYVHFHPFHPVHPLRNGYGYDAYGWRYE